MSLIIENNTGTRYSYGQNLNFVKKEEITFFDYQPDDKAAKRAQCAKERYKAIHDGTLVYHKGGDEKPTYLFGIFKLPTKHKPAYYTYKATGKEFIIQIRNRFGIKEGAIGRYNDYYNKPDVDGCKPSPGTIIGFYEYDVE